MIKLAITGNIASGKSLIESMLDKKGILTIDTDKIVHGLLDKDEELINKIKKLFSEDITDDYGKIDRKKLGKKVFYDKNKLRNLEKIIHPQVKKILEKFFYNNKN